MKNDSNDNISLATILDKKKEIIDLIECFGYKTEVKLHYDVSEEVGPLSVVISINDNTTYDWYTDLLLAAKLSELLDCSVNVYVTEKIQPLSRYDVQLKSRSINDIEELGKLFGSLDVTFKKIGEDDKVLHQAMLKNANQYLEKQSEKSKTESKEPHPKLKWHSTDGKHLLFTKRKFELKDPESSCKKLKVVKPGSSSSSNSN